MLGTWQTTIDGAITTLSLTGTGYTINRAGARGTGSFTVEGNTISFYGSSLCDGRGSYEWSIVEDTLELVGRSEECPGRAEALSGRRYTRMP